MWSIVKLSAEHLPQRVEILAQRSNLTPQRAKNSLINCLRYRSRFKRKADLLRTFPLFVPETSKLESVVVCSEKKEFLPVKSLLLHAEACTEKYYLDEGGFD